MAKNIFNSVKFPGVDTNRFDLSHDLKLSFSMGELVPTCVMDCLPGDKVSINVENLLRFAPLVSPVMHKVNVTTHFFFVPNRLVWPEWEQWITGNSDAQAPFITVGPSGESSIVVEGSLADYLGIPTGEYTQDIQISPMAMAAYLKIWDEFYRDQNLQSPLFEALTPGDNTTAYFTWIQESPLYRAWMHDYFTSALPFAQKGDAVQLPLTVANGQNVYYENQGGTAAENTMIVVDVNGDPINPGGGAPSLNVEAGPTPLISGLRAGGNPAAIDPNGLLKVDVQGDAVDINTVRRAFRLQEWLERNARGGTRYVENILAHFGVKSSDARLQRPEYLGGAKQNMVISEVLATAENTEAGVNVGQMAGHGISVGGGNRFTYRCEEHGFIIGLINVQPVTAYQDGLHRSFSRFNRLDYAWPTFANIGEQEVLQKEVKARVASGSPDRVFGYVPRYAEYKFMNSRVAGEMRSSLDFWHLGRQFASDPALNELFIKCVPDTRIFAVTDPDVDHIYAHVFNRISAVRKLPKYGIPTI